MRFGFILARLTISILGHNSPLFSQDLLRNKNGETWPQWSLCSLMRDKETNYVIIKSFSLYIKYTFYLCSGPQWNCKSSHKAMHKWNCLETSIKRTEASLKGVPSKSATLQTWSVLCWAALPGVATGQWGPRQPLVTRGRGREHQLIRNRETRKEEGWHPPWSHCHSSLVLNLEYYRNHPLLFYFSTITKDITCEFFQWFPIN